MNFGGCRKIENPSAAEGIANGKSTKVSSIVLIFPHFFLTIILAIAKPNIILTIVDIAAMDNEFIKLTQSEAILLSD